MNIQTGDNRIGLISNISDIKNIIMTYIKNKEEILETYYRKSLKKTNNNMRI